jgi:V-type H+-transporting ATPase subunit H
MRTVATATNQSGNENRTWDEYASELSSGHLSWTPAHSSDFFWRENVTKLNEKDHFYLKFVLPAEVLPKKQKQISSARQLIELLRSSQDTLVLAVAAHDLGQYVKYHERGKK